MKNKMFTMFGLGLLVSSMAVATVIPDTKAFFVPVGFDSNDEVTIVADGYLPNSCLRMTQPLIKPDLQSHTIIVQPRAKKAQLCPLDFKVPFTTEIHLGALPPGNYTVKTEDGTIQEKLAVVKAPTEAVDDYMYAPVDRVYVRATADGGFEAVIEGRFAGNCDRVAKFGLSHTGKTLQLLPIMERNEKTEDGGVCEEKETSFSVRKRLPEMLPGRYLLHVRSLNGQSKNDVFNNFWVR